MPVRSSIGATSAAMPASATAAAASSAEDRLRRGRCHAAGRRVPAPRRSALSNWRKAVASPVGRRARRRPPRRPPGPPSPPGAGQGRERRQRPDASDTMRASRAAVGRGGAMVLLVREDRVQFLPRPPRAAFPRTRRRQAGAARAEGGQRGAGEHADAVAGHPRSRTGSRAGTPAGRGPGGPGTPARTMITPASRTRTRPRCGGVERRGRGSATASNATMNASTATVTRAPPGRARAGAARGGQSRRASRRICSRRLGSRRDMCRAKCASATSPYSDTSAPTPRLGARLGVRLARERGDVDVEAAAPLPAQHVLRVQALHDRQDRRVRALWPTRGR